MTFTILVPFPPIFLSLSFYVHFVGVLDALCWLSAVLSIAFPFFELSICRRSFSNGIFGGVSGTEVRK